MCLNDSALLPNVFVLAILTTTTSSSSAAAAAGINEAVINADDAGLWHCEHLLVRQLSLRDDVCDTWLPPFNVTQLTTLCRSVRHSVPDHQGRSKRGTGATPPNRGLSGFLYGQNWLYSDVGPALFSKVN